MASLSRRPMGVHRLRLDWVAEESGAGFVPLRRWSPDPLRWVWVPDDVWGPAWVSWRYGDDYVGWAPLPPRARWVAGVGLDLGGVNLDFAISDRAYTFVPQRHFVNVPIRSHAVPLDRNTRLVRATRNHTTMRFGPHRRQSGVPVERIERVTDSGAAAPGRDWPRPIQACATELERS